MSYNLITAQGFESDNTPFTLTGTMARSTTSPLAGTYSLRGGDGLAVDGQATWVLPTASRPNTGSRKGLRLDVRFKFARGTATTPTGGTLEVFNMQGPGGSALCTLQILTASDKLKILGVVGATALSTTTHDIRIDYREERGGTISGIYVRVYLDGALEITSRAFGGLVTLQQILMGVGASGKATWDARWDDMTVKVAYDPQ
jgi:hypothetical protein